MGKIIEGLWDCPFCGNKRIRAGQKTCPDCGHPQDENTKFYMPDEIKYVSEADAAHSGNLRSNHFWHDVMPGTEDVEKPVYRKEPVYATKYYYEIDKWTVVDTAKSSGNDQNPSWPEPKLKDGQRTGAEEEHYFVTATYEKKKGKTETGRYEMDFSQWKELKKGEKIELKIDAAGFAEINQK